MSRVSTILAALALAATPALVEAADTPLGTFFTYQGRLTQSGTPVAAPVDLRFRLYDESLAGTQIGTEQEVFGVPITDGVFTVDLDFGAFNGNERWLEIDVKLASDPVEAWETLAPRQPIMPAPVATFALDSPNSSPFIFAGSDAVFDAGNVGIGTASPFAALSVLGGANAQTVRFEGDDGAYRFLQEINASSQASWTFRNGPGSAGNAMKIASNGNVGIGTTDPLRPLHVRRNDLLVAGAAVGGDTSFIVAANDPNLDLIGLDTGSELGGISLKEVNSSGALIDNWSLHRRTSNANSILRFTYGTSKDAWVNPSVMTLSDSGNVGIGTTDPATLLHLSDGLSTTLPSNNRDLLITANDAGIELVSTQGGSVGSFLNFKEVDGSGAQVDNWTIFRRTPAAGSGLDIRYGPVESTGNTSIMKMQPNGNVGIGTTSPDSPLHVADGSSGIVPSVNTVVAIDSSSQNSYVQMLAPTDGFHGLVFGHPAETFDGGIYYNHNDDSLSLRTDNNETQLAIDGSGKTSVKVLEILGGADIVEGFDTADDANVEPGTVMVIDPANPGALMASTDAYDFKVAGVVSGANGVNPGIHLGQDGVLDGDTKVAMTGRVYVKCSTENGPIRPGDRLTTASRAGHAMKATDAMRSDGAVIGKAMSSLDGETGLVLVLVNLQ